MKRSMAVNIYLKQFHCPMDDILSRIKTGDVEKMGAEEARGLGKIMPTDEEVLLMS